MLEPTASTQPTIQKGNFNNSARKFRKNSCKTFHRENYFIQSHKPAHHTAPQAAARSTVTPLSRRSLKSAFLRIFKKFSEQLCDYCNYCRTPELDHR